MNKKQKNLLIRIIIAAILFVPLYLISEGHVHVAVFEEHPFLLFLFFLVPYLLVGHDILRKAFKGIMNRQVFDENFLMTVATVGAIALGEYGEGVAVMLLYQVGELFQSYAVGKSRRNISELMDIRPDYANIEAEDGSLERVDPDEVEVGSIIVVQPGEKIPLDGEITEGSSALNTSALTGESKPREVAAGDEVLSGSINMSGVLKIRTTTEFDESTASKILDLVENAASRKSKSENFIYADRLLCGSGAGSDPADLLHAHRRWDASLCFDGRTLGGLGAACLHLPGHQLPVCRCHQYSAELLRRHRRRQQPGYSGQGIQLSGDTL